jgi:outer membrane usher protein
VNYTLSANFDSEEYWHMPDYNGLFGYFDGRLFTSLGTLDSSFSAHSAPDQGEYVTRLDTAWGYSDRQTIRTYVAGDFISSGLAWTRSTTWVPASRPCGRWASRSPSTIWAPATPV